MAKKRKRSQVSKSEPDANQHAGPRARFIPPKKGKPGKVVKKGIPRKAVRRCDTLLQMEQQLTNLIYEATQIEDSGLVKKLRETHRKIGDGIKSFLKRYAKR